MTGQEAACLARSHVATVVPIKALPRADKNKSLPYGTIGSLLRLFMDPATHH